jgi:putative phage-type endonuclease
MNKKKSSPKIDLEYLVHTTIKEFDLTSLKADHDFFKKYIYDIFSHMYRLDKIRFKFDTEFIRIMKANEITVPPEYDEIDIKNILQQIQHIDKLPKQKQKSNEWHDFRKNNITASSIKNICGKNNSSYYQEIKKKCCPSDVRLTGHAILHGVKYEDVAIAVYERRNRIKVLEYGCLPHKYISHLAASPDGICDYSPHNPSYTGRMLEIKCPYSRQITGVIPESYLYQIQAQLEVCDLYYCDFLECKILDFLSFEELNEYIKTISNASFRSDEYGVVLEYTMSFNNDTKYAYSEIGLTEDDLDDWINEKIDEINTEDSNFLLNKISYWVLEYSNTVLVKRDRMFFEKIVPVIGTFWKDVEHFRQNPDDLTKRLSSSRPKNDYYAIDLLINKGSDSESDKIDENNKSVKKNSFGSSSGCLFLDSDSEGDVIIKGEEDLTKKNIKKISKNKKTMKEHFRENKKPNKAKYKKMLNFSVCMID